MDALSVGIGATEPSPLDHRLFSVKSISVCPRTDQINLSTSSYLPFIDIFRASIKLPYRHRLRIHSSFPLTAIPNAAIVHSSSEFPASEPPKPNASRAVKRILQTSLTVAGVCVLFGGTRALMRHLLATLPPDFNNRWKQLLDGRVEPHFARVEDPIPPTTLYDCHGQIIAVIGPQGLTSTPANDRLRRQGSKAPLQPDEVSVYMWQAILASEDRSFFIHHGFDPRGLARALLSLARMGGGSTITQQVVKNEFLSHERTWQRKLMEVLLAVWLERHLSKWDILHLYVNKIYWGHGVYGLEAAAALYFGKHPSQLSLGESAMLAGIIPAPELLSPFRDPSRGRKAEARSLRRMVEAGYIDPATARAALDQPLQLATEGHLGVAGPWRAPYFVSEVLYELSQEYGRERVLHGGLQVYTSLDLGMQDAAERIVMGSGQEFDRERIAAAQKGIRFCEAKLAEIRQQTKDSIALHLEQAVQKRAHQANLSQDGSSVEAEGGSESAMEREEEEIVAAETEKSERRQVFWINLRGKYERELKEARHARLEGALVAMDPLTGDVRVLVGGRDYYESNFNRATQANRPPGSTFKPVVYLAALSEGLNKDHELLDEPYSVGDFVPENYDKKFRGKVTLEGSLVRSLNVPTVKLCAEVGMDKVISTARALGIHTSLPYELALSLGGCEVSPVQLTTVYNSLAAGGVYRPPRLILKVIDSDGSDMQYQAVEYPPHDYSLGVDPEAVAELRRLMQSVVERGTGRGARLGRPCAGKTGTSDGHRDVWFAGFTPQLACTVWFGYDTNEPVGGVHPGTGASHAAPVWQHFMKTVHKDLPVLKFHDVGSDRYGSRAPKRQFQKRSRRPTRSSIKGDRGRDVESTLGQSLWAGVWDWHRASSIEEEREKMAVWVREREERRNQRLAVRAWWGSEKGPWNLPFEPSGSVDREEDIDGHEFHNESRGGGENKGVGGDSHGRGGQSLVHPLELEVREACAREKPNKDSDLVASFCEGLKDRIEEGWRR